LQGKLASSGESTEQAQNLEKVECSALICTLRMKLKSAFEQRHPIGEDWMPDCIALQRLLWCIIQRDKYIQLNTSGSSEIQHDIGDSPNDQADFLQRTMVRLEQENETLTCELDKVLQENSQLRLHLDALQYGEEDMNKSPVSANGKNRSFSIEDEMDTPTSRGNFASDRQSGIRIFSLRQGDSTMISTRPRRTCGVHTLRLKRTALCEWRAVVLEVRLWGRNLNPNCMDFLVDTNGGSLSGWPSSSVVRVRRSDFDARTGERVGSGSFAEVFRGDLRIPVAVKRMRGTTGRKELADFVREVEMMRAVSHPCVVQLIAVHLEQDQCYLLQVGINSFFQSV
jgi:hypothetical protein